MTPPKDQAPWLVARVKRALDRKPDATRCDLTRETVEGLIHAYEQLEAENAELRGKLEKDQEAMVMFIHAASCSPYMREAVDKVRAALTEQANIRSPVQSLVRDQYNPEDEK